MPNFVIWWRIDILGMSMKFNSEVTELKFDAPLTSIFDLHHYVLQSKYSIVQGLI